MAKDRDDDALGTNQSKKPATAFVDLGDQPQHPPPPHQQQLHHRTKAQKHLVGGATGGRVHARIPSTKALHKHHAATSTAKLNRRHGTSLSPDQGAGQALASHHHHRRATSELKLTRDTSSTNLKKNASQTNLKRNRSQAEVGKRTKSATNLHRSASNPAVDRLKPFGSSRVQFNLGDEAQDDGDQDEDEWVDASASASPLLSRRGSAVSSGHNADPGADDEDSPAPSPTPHREDERSPGHGTQSGTTNGAANGKANGTQPGAHSLPRNQYLTSRILSRAPSHGAPPMMSTETASVGPSSSRQPSPPDSSLGQGPSPPTTTGATTQVRPGSSGNAELTSRFVGNNSQEPGSGNPNESFILAANRGGLSRAALNGKDGFDMPKRRQSLGALSQARGIDALNARQAAAGNDHSDGNDDDEVTPGASRAPRNGAYVMPREMNRTQQKLNLQRASSSLEPAHPHPGIGIGPAGVAVGGGPLLGVPTSYDSRDPRIGKMLERTGMEYLTVRRHLNPVARSISRVMQLPDIESSRQIPRPRSAAHHASRLSEQFNPSQREPLTRDSSMVDLISGHAGGSGGSTRRPPTPRGSGSGGTFSGLHSASSSLSTDGGGGAGRMHERAGLSGASLVSGAEDAETMALLRMMWDKNMNLSASQD
ncbi:uncharacterized protein THITE_123702 [Thermothielavioides terrestris NRRL 8126]|uniref:Uncharacterized protein n=1 Tax=Thermothielavioides terrestris (strain ATCC 38088 / NRRL 8126) TaxID=578455 RepID=G2QSM7_THETT|nr:uncharacterized protein THITE_123702 [Thermothielavioides terrestris NRRL 8126]AEO64310.1 hypothetical protein THITE_123702 [Thermothielavioides terrestris NRRL 8126]